MSAFAARKTAKTASNVSKLELEATPLARAETEDGEEEARPRKRHKKEYRAPAKKSPRDVMTAPPQELETASKNTLKKTVSAPHDAVQTPEMPLSESDEYHPSISSGELDGCSSTDDMSEGEQILAGAAPSRQLSTFSPTPQKIMHSNDRALTLSLGRKDVR